MKRACFNDLVVNQNNVDTIMITGILEAVIKPSRLGNREHLNLQSRLIHGLTGKRCGEGMGSRPHHGQMVSVPRKIVRVMRFRGCSELLDV